MIGLWKKYNKTRQHFIKKNFINSYKSDYVTNYDSRNKKNKRGDREGLLKLREISQTKKNITRHMTTLKFVVVFLIRLT